MVELAVNYGTGQGVSPSMDLPLSLGGWGPYFLHAIHLYRPPPINGRALIAHLPLNNYISVSSFTRDLHEQKDNGKNLNKYGINTRLYIWLFSLSINSSSIIFHNLLASSSMASFHFSVLFLEFCLWVSLISPTQSQSCKSQSFKGNKLYAHCLDLPTLSSYLHFTYDSSNSTLSIAFIASPSKSDGWISWGINPTEQKMAGSRALVGYKGSSGVMTLKTYNISGYTPDAVVKSKLDFDVWDTSAEEQSGVMRLFAKIKVPADLAAKGTVNQVWQVGPRVDDEGVLTIHDLNGANRNAKGSLDLKSGQSTGGGGVDSRTKKKNIHGVLNAVSWGILFPIGIIIARYLRTFKSADPAWFYLHVTCQVSAYGLGVAGWATGIKLGSESKGITYSTHRNIGIALFAIATLQMFALFLRPKKDHKFRFYWNLYHHGVGYTILVLGIVNIFKGLDILQPASKWKSAFIVVIAILGGIALLLELVTWTVVWKRRSGKSTKPYDGHNGQRRQQPLTSA